MRPSALTHAIGLIQPNVKPQEELDSFTSYGCGSRKEFLTAREAQLRTQFLQHQPIGQSKKKWFLPIPKGQVRSTKQQQASSQNVLEHWNRNTGTGTLWLEHSPKGQTIQWDRWGKVSLLVGTPLVGLQAYWHGPRHQLLLHVATLRDSLFDLLHHFFPNTRNSHMGWGPHFPQSAY